MSQRAETVTIPSQRRSRAARAALPSASRAITIDGVRPLAINKKQAAIALGSIKTLQRLLWCARHQPDDPWIKIVREGRPGTECLIDTDSLEAAYARMSRGENPPLMPSERRAMVERDRIAIRLRPIESEGATN